MPPTPKCLANQGTLAQRLEHRSGGQARLRLPFPYRALELIAPRNPAAPCGPRWGAHWRPSPAEGGDALAGRSHCAHLRAGRAREARSALRQRLGKVQPTCHWQPRAPGGQHRDAGRDAKSRGRDTATRAQKSHRRAHPDLLLRGCFPWNGVERSGLVWSPPGTGEKLFSTSSPKDEAQGR